MDVERLRRDAEAGIAGAQYNFGVWHLFGESGRKDAEQARKWLLAAADQEFAPAQSALGFLYQRAQGVEQDFSIARSWFDRAARQDFPEALYCLGELLALGLGGNDDATAARRCYERAAKQGHPAAVSQLAYCDDYGIGGPADPVSATQWYSQGVNAGDPRALFAMARRYESGNTVPKNRVKARALYQLAEDKNYPLAAERGRRIADTLHKKSIEEANCLAAEPFEIDVPDSSNLAPEVPEAPENRSMKPLVATIRHLITPDECAHMMNTARPNLHPSRVLRQASGELAETSGRTSGEMTFGDGLKDLVVHNVECRLAQVAGIPVENGEALIILHYDEGDEYRPHHDYFDPERAGTSAVLERGGQRVCTLLTYLNDVPAGGETDFPEVGLNVAPEAGMGLLFFNVRADGSVDPATRHAGYPVRAGEKWLATKWFREHAVPK